MHLAASSGGQLVGGELPDLLVGERVVRGLGLRLGQQQARLDGGQQIVGQRVRPVARLPRLARRRQVRPPDVARSVTRSSLRLADSGADRPQIAQAEAAPEDGGITEHRASVRREPGGAAIDEGPDRGRDESRRIAAQPPLTVDLLQRARLPVGPGQLLHDERDALGLGVDRGGRRGLQRIRRGPA